VSDRDAPPLPLAAWREALIDIAREAGAIVLEVYASDFAVRGKSDRSPVTAADERAEALILRRLRTLEPRLPIVAEEEVAAGRTPPIDQRFWLVDPLDGTREFVSRNGEFTVNIALVANGVPVLGVVLAPALGRLFAGADGLGAIEETDAPPGVSPGIPAGRTRRRIACRPPPTEGLTVLSSRSHGDADALARFLAGRHVTKVVVAGSSLKFCLLAAGEADLYPRLGRTMEWDIAAGHAVLRAAGGEVRQLDGQPLRYGKAGFENPHFVASTA
jgi:3'(2'), 5'-bisphosphate nucleotidase